MNRLTTLTEPQSSGSREMESAGTNRADPITAHAVRVESVDTAHPAWEAVLRSIIRSGGADALLICDDGRLSARQTVLAAMTGAAVVGHLVFRIEPAAGRSVRARMDSFDVDPAFTSAGVERLLATTAGHQAKVRRCPEPEPVAC
jgi:hypothetical protein